MSAEAPCYSRFDFNRMIVFFSLVGPLLISLKINIKLLQAN